MSTRTETAFRYSFPSEKVFTAITAPEAITERLRAVGGPGAELKEHHVGENGQVTAVMSLTVPSEKLPKAIQSLTSGPLRIERTEIWRTDGVGTVGVEVPGAPARINGTMTLRAVDETSAEVRVEVDVKVSVPLFGRTVETAITDYLSGLLAREHDLMESWLREHP